MEAIIIYTSDVGQYQTWQGITSELHLAASSLIITSNKDKHVKMQTKPMVTFSEFPVSLFLPPNNNEYFPTKVPLYKE
jgi:hypothetical protein